MSAAEETAVVDAAALLAKVERLAAWCRQAKATAQTAQAEAAMLRSRLGGALSQALAERAAAVARAEALALARFVDARRGRARP
ncbi:MAG: hypothetical protein ACK4YQ_06545, partial [Phenylobacterium sp.]|uniref:hypothetical protein n=1 Tax=Phenylobacterium sp. TaxID=1871053 RepID=UPI00391C3784